MYKYSLKRSFPRSKEGIQTVNVLQMYETILLKEVGGKGADLSNFGNEWHL